MPNSFSPHANPRDGKLPSIPRVLSIAGTDPSGGAGIQADLKSIGAAGGYGMSVTTALVAQNTQGVREIFTPPQSFLTSQLNAVGDDITIDAVKIGMLGDAETTHTVEQWLYQNPGPIVVLDPVMVASSGDSLLNSSAEASVRELAAKVDVITPNIPELAVLVEKQPAADLEEAIAQALEFAERTGTTVLVKGGHLEGKWADNAVVTGDGNVERIPTARIETKNTHGTGCSLSSALATRLGMGETVADGARWATEWLHDSIWHADKLHVGNGNGPVDHFHQLRSAAAAGSARPWLLNSYITSAPQLSEDELPGYSPRIKPAGPFTEALWNASAPIWKQILSLEFLLELRDGTLSDSSFTFYLQQDAHFLKQCSRALAMISAKAPDSADQIAWSNTSHEVLAAEAEIHRTWLGERDGSLDKVDISHDEYQDHANYHEASPVTLAYTNMLAATVSVRDYVVGAAALLPYYWVYAEAALRLSEHNHAWHPYSQWLNLYGGTDFVESTQLALDRVERAMAAANEPQRRLATRHYLYAFMHEREFFDQAQRLRW
ncbi:bifunctional hydroxymethylpyrimidine kinase/phosphomethylpyrimidine kinase [Corynebacterium sp. H113]|uniref:bifunctional hydroxymethylpyrimidine kinase/phosphomethylpyrimidine kinase n=1 Tax=Corynebacterium sp. H113 TaxID=3133419 RepID=UPI003099E31E